MDQTEPQPVVKVAKSILSAASSLEQFFCCYETSERSANGRLHTSLGQSPRSAGTETLKSLTLNTLAINPT